jgi:predicted mannosyl-3-phosphoglycerate phosphatase (HAD superfamily)
MESRKRAAVRIRPKNTSARGNKRHRMAVFTAVDGTLLDSRTFEAGESRTTIARLLAADIPVIPMSVMTLDELSPIAAELGLQTAMVIEGGGAIARWKDGAWEVEPCGPPAETFLGVILKIEDLSGARLSVYSVMEESEAAKVSGRSGDMLLASTRRRFSEPFLIESGNLGKIRRAAEEIGFSVRRGRRFFHLCRECDEGEPFSRLREELRCDVTIAVGGSLVDAEFLTRADLSIVVPASDGGIDAELLAKVPTARIASSPAPAGWSPAVEEAVRMAASRRRARSAAS